MRRGVELSLNLIIIIVIGLIIAAITIYLVTTNANRANRDVAACAAKGGRCDTQCDAGETGSTFFNEGCTEGEICCTKPFGEGA